jgi:hypothetical protein
MADFVDYKQGLRRYFPKPFYNITDQGLGPILDMAGSLLNEAGVEVQNMREQFLLAKAAGKYLDIHGINSDVIRPKGARIRDSIYRELIKSIAYSPKNLEESFERLLKIMFGENVFERGYADVYMYRANEVVVQVSETALIIALQRDLNGTTYIHEGHEGYDGNSLDLFTTTGPALPVNSMTMTLPTVPSGMPTSGMMELESFGSLKYEVKNYTRLGNLVTFISPTRFVHLSNFLIQGPMFPNDYPSGYIFDQDIESSIVGPVLAGQTTAVAIANLTKWPLTGIAYLGTPGELNFECKAFSRIGSAFTFEGPCQFSHTSGEMFQIPFFVRKIRTTLCRRPVPSAFNHEWVRFPSFTGGSDLELEL